MESPIGRRILGWLFSLMMALESWLLWVEEWRKEEEMTQLWLNQREQFDIIKII